jgi:nicotinate-nucleotide adenylyltransferase
MIGMLGGTFDPIHFGHLRIALEVLECYGLEQMRFIPSADPPHRDPPAVAAAQRFEMVREAVAGEGRFIADDRELRRQGKSYTLHTLRSLRDEMGDAPILMLLGSDAFAGVPSWHQPEAVFELAHVIVMARPGEPLPELYSRRWTRDPATLAEQPAGRILPHRVSQLEISASEIRRLIAAGRSPRYLLPESVLALIWRNGYYR